MPDLEAKIRIRLETEQIKRDAEKGERAKDRAEQRGAKRRERTGGGAGAVAAGAAATGGARGRGRGAIRKGAGVIGTLALIEMTGPALAQFVTGLLSPILPAALEKKIDEAVNDIITATLTPIITELKAIFPALEQTKDATVASMILGKVPTTDESAEIFDKLHTLKKEDLQAERSRKRMTLGMVGKLGARGLRAGPKISDEEMKKMNDELRKGGVVPEWFLKIMAPGELW